MRRIGLHAAIVTLPAIVMLTLVGGLVSAGAAEACVSQPASLEHSSLAPEGGDLKVKAGAIVYVVIGEPEKYLTVGDPKAFPWLAPSSSSTSLLPVKLCPKREVSTLPERVFAFRASRHGTAEVVAKLAPAWSSAPPRRRRGLKPFRSTVTVTG
jgi:hypothetical protein